MMGNKTHIRPHHALCAQFFIGKGYSERFIEHMRCLLTDLDNCDPEVTLTDGCDGICSCCPKNTDGICSEDARAIDLRALDAMGLSFGDAMSWSELRKLASSTIIESGRLEEICGDCEWISICKSGR